MQPDTQKKLSGFDASVYNIELWTNNAEIKGELKFIPAGGP